MTASENRLPMKVQEPLAETAPLALNWSKHECIQANDEHSGCAWYHGSWQVFRLLGVFHSILSDDDFFIPTLARLIDGGVRRVLISGAADYALLARVAAAAGPLAKDMRVTVVDLCNTPLKLNAWYGERFGIPVEVIKENVLDYRPSEPFDLICTHSFLCFFNQAERRQLVQRWWKSLKPGAWVLTAQRARTEDRQPIIAYSKEEVEALSSRTRRKAEEQYETHGIEPDVAHQLAEGYGRFHWTHLIRTAEEIQRLFEDQGFKLETFSPPGGEQPVTDTPGTPNQAGSVRWRILAGKPKN
jgi:SAM-dependent methyltransferase